MSYIQWNSIMLYGFILWIWLPCAILGFNVDTKNINVIAGPKGTLFGFSASFVPQDANSDYMRMLIGAPNAGTIDGGANSGALYECENVRNENGGCSTQRYYDDDKSMADGTLNEEFGSTLTMTNSGNFMVCSPNWKDTKTPYFIFVPGRCVLYSQGTDMPDHMMPFYHTGSNRKNYIIKVNGKNEYSEGLATFGFSADSDRKSIFVFGAPGVYVSEGTVVIKDMNTTFTSKASSEGASALSSTAYGYLGYSVKIGRFCDGSDTCFAASAPNRNRVGMVLIYRWVNQKGLTIHDKFESLQAWSYFGYALCAADTDFDGYDELLVGSPFYTDMKDALQGYDQGRVFVYRRSQTDQKFRQLVVLDGSRQKFSRFGSAIQNIGDINLDKYKDVVVGAPGENEGAGCIYIYLGGPAGLSPSPSQRITSKQVSNGLQSPVNGFGFAFSDHATPARQTFSMFAATSVVSDTIVVFKTRPIVDVVVNLTAEPNPIDLQKACTEQGVTGTCFAVNMCMEFQLRGGGNAVLTFKIGIDMDVQIRANSKRALIRLKNSSLVDSITEFSKTLVANAVADCTKFVAVLRDIQENQVNQDRFTPIEIIAKYTLVEEPKSDINPVLDAMKPNNVSLAVTFLHRCGPDNICEVDLSVNGNLNYKHTGSWRSIVVNSTKELQVNVGVKNSKETAFWTSIKLEIDSTLSYSRFMSDVPISCKQERAVLDAANTAANIVPIGLDKTTVLCNYYKPLYQNASFSLMVVFETEKIELTKKTLTITAEVMPKNMKNPEVSPKDNAITMETNVEIIADVVIDGTSSPTEDAVYEVKKISETDSGNQGNVFRKTGNEVKPFNVTHKILVNNKGPSFLPKTTVSVRVPMFLLDRTELIHEAHVKITTADGRVTQCYGTIKFDYLHQTTDSTAQTFTTTPTGSSGIDEDTSGGIPDTTVEATTNFEIGPPNRRKKRASDDKGDQSTIYTLDCENSYICQVFVCEIGTTIPSGSHAEINVSLVIDKANIPMPENYNAFYYTVQAEVDDPTHALFRNWDQKPTVKTVTKFHLVQSGGKVNIWIIIGCVIAGLVLITIIVLVFWKLGFFKRDKHKQVAQWKRESQRQSRKGYSKAPAEDADMGGSNLKDGDL